MTVTERRPHEEASSPRPVKAAASQGDPRSLRQRCQAIRLDGEQCRGWAIRGADWCAPHAPGIPAAPRSWAKRCKARRSDGRPCTAWAMHGCEVCRVHGGTAPAVRARARRRQHDVMVFERAIRDRAIALHGDYVEGEAARRWVSEVLGREAAERGVLAALDRMEAEAAAGPPTDGDLERYRAAAAEAVPLAAFLDVMRERWGWIARRVAA